MCQQTTKSVVERKTEDIYGNQLWFSTITHGHSEATKEFVLTKETFNFKRWLVLMTIFSTVAFYCEFYTADASLLGLFLCFLCVIFMLKLHLKVKQESLLVIASLGLQLTTTFVTGRKASQFILREDIADVVINEGIFMNRVLFYLAVLLKDVNHPFKIKGIIPLFRAGDHSTICDMMPCQHQTKQNYTFPRLDALEYIYNGVQTSFYLNQKEHEN